MRFNEHPDPPSFGDDFPPPGLSLDDAPAPLDGVGDLGAPVPGEPGWRTLLQADLWVRDDGSAVRLADLTTADIAALRHHLRCYAHGLHAAAAEAERATTSAAVAWMFHNLNIPLISDLSPQAWLATTPLMRRLTQQTPPASTGWDTHDLGPRCTDDGCEEPR